MVKEIINVKARGLQKLPTVLNKKDIRLSIRDLKIKSKQLYVKNRMYVPENKSLQLFLLQQHHNSLIHGHLKYKAMYWKIQERYFWFDMAKHCKQYASNCLTCRQTKAYTVQKQDFLNLLPISNRKWMDLSLNFVVKLPKCRQRNCVFQHILVVVDQLTKKRLYEPLETLHTSKFINVMYCWVFALYGFLLTTVNDRGGQMTAILWRRLCKQYGINIKFSLAHHPETDSQTKSANRVIKNYLRAYIAYTQDNWIDYLSIAKFTASNHVNASTNITSFFTNYGFNPCTGIEPPGTYKGEKEQQAKLLVADKIIAWQAEMMTFLQDQLA